MSTAMNTAMEEILWAATWVMALITLSATEKNLLKQRRNLKRRLICRREWRMI